jgi:hypothetical protein
MGLLCPYCVIQEPEFSLGHGRTIIPVNGIRWPEQARADGFRPPRGGVAQVEHQCGQDGFGIHLGARIYYRLGCGLIQRRRQSDERCTPKPRGARSGLPGRHAADPDRRRQETSQETSYAHKAAADPHRPQTHQYSPTKINPPGHNRTLENAASTSQFSPGDGVTHYLAVIRPLLAAVRVLGRGDRPTYSSPRR